MGNIAPEVQELKTSLQNKYGGNRSKEYEMHNNTKAPAFDKSLRTNRISAMQSRIERRMHGEDKDIAGQHFIAKTRSSGSVLEMARNLDTQQAEQESLEEYEAHKQGKPKYNRAVSDDPSSLLFTPEQLVKIAVHKAAISKQLDANEEQRKVVQPNYPNSNPQNVANVYHIPQQNGLCQQHQQQELQEQAQLTAQRQLEEQEEQERKRQESLKQLQEQERNRQLQEQERQQQLREQQEKDKQRQEQEKRQLQEQEKQRGLKEQQERERQRQLQEQEQQRQLLKQERIRQLQEQERERQLLEQQEKQRLLEEQQEMKKQRQIQEQEEQERQQKLREEKEREIQEQK